MNTPDKVIGIAETEVGYLEKKDDNLEYLYDKTANAGNKNYTKYGYEMHQIYPSVMDYPAYWCACFVDWCFQKAYGIATAKSLLNREFEDYTVAAAQQYKNHSAYYKNNPKVGDQIFFNNGTRICHTGLVYKVDASRVYTIEGNTSGASGVVANGGGVAKKSYLLSYARIDGYGRPRYDTNSSSAPVDTDVQNTNGLIMQGLVYANKFTGVEDKVVSKAKARVLQHAINLDYKVGLVEDGVFGTKSNKALGAHYVKRGEKQYMVTAAEILFYLNGYNPKGVEIPGIYGSGLQVAVRQKFGTDGSRVSAANFITLIK